MRRWDPTAEDLQVIMDIGRAGGYYPKIAERFGITRRTVDRYMAKHPDVKEAFRAARATWRPDHGVNRYNNYGCRCAECRRANAARARRMLLKRMDRKEGAPHGTAGGYTNWGCRCDECSLAHSALLAEQRRSRSERMQDCPHGTRSGYISWGCRCEPCREAAWRDRRQRQVVAA